MSPQTPCCSYIGICAGQYIAFSTQAGHVDLTALYLTLNCLVLGALKLKSTHCIYLRTKYSEY